LPSITGFDAKRADIAEAEHGAAVRDDADEVAATRCRAKAIARIVA
jgi:hypothetical protein